MTGHFKGTICIYIIYSMAALTCFQLSFIVLAIWYIYERFDEGDNE
jgi:hypothetical protein